MALRAAAYACIAKGRRPKLGLTVRHFTTKFPATAANSLCGTPMFHNSPAIRHRIRAISTETKVEPKPSAGVGENWKVKMLYDGECPLCMREVNMLKERNKDYGAIKFVDISSDEYSPQEHEGLDYETAMGRIHAILSDGTVVTDVEAFRRLYEEVGLGWVYAITKYEPIATIANAVYSFWAKYRLQVTGRPSLEAVLEVRRKNRGEVCKDDKSCNI